MKKPRRLNLVQLCSLLLSLLLAPVHAASAGFQPDLKVKVASDADAGYVGDGVYEVNAALQSKAQATFAGTTAVYRFQLQNAGTSPDSFVLTGTRSGTGFTVQYLDESGTDRSAAVTGAGFGTAMLAPGQTVSLLARVTPTVLTVGASYRVSLTAASALDPAKLDQVKTETVVCGSSAAVIVSVPTDASGIPGSVVTYPYTVTNVGSGVNSFALSVTSGAGWSAAIYADDGAGAGIAGDGVRQSGENVETAATGPLQPGASYRFFVAVTVPPSSVDGAHADTRLTVAGEGAATSDQVTTTASAANVSVAENVRNITQGGPFAANADAFPGDTLEYRMSITNSGQSPATTLSVETPLPQHVSYLPGTLWIGTASEGNGNPCPAAECGTARLAAGSIVARLGQGATDSSGGALAPGKTLHVFYRVHVE